MENLPKAKKVLVVSTGPLAALNFGFWCFLGAVSAFGALLMVHRLVRLGWPLLRTWWPL